MKDRSSHGDSASTKDGDERVDLDRPTKRTRYHRHAPQQIQELETVFKECPHPDEKRRWELSKRLELDPRQVKFWFQNRRTQIKTQHKRNENAILRQENEKLRAENMSMRDAMRSPVCGWCGSPAVVGELPLQQQLRMENAQLKDELDRVCDLARKFIGGLDAAGIVTDDGLGGVSLVSEFSAGGPSSVSEVPGTAWLELALAAMDELMRLVQQVDGAMWVGTQGGRQILNYDEYLRVFPRCVVGPKPVGFAAEATRDSSTVMMDSLVLAESLMDSSRWAEMFSCIVARASTVDMICGDVGGNKNGRLLRMNAELQVLSPLVPLCRVNFLRFCKQHANGVWAVVDVSVDDGIETTTTSPSSMYMSCRRLPSGCVVQELPSGFCKVTWIEHIEYDETMVHQLYRPLLRAGMGFGAQRWLATLRRYCECSANFMSFAVTNQDPSGLITLAGRRSMVKLAKRMTSNFYGCVCPSTRRRKWNRLYCLDSIGKDVRVMTRSSVDSPGEPPGVVLSATTSVWLPVVSPQRLFDFLRDEHLRSEWDILSSGGPMQGIAHVVKGHHLVNCVSLLRATAMNEKEKEKEKNEESSSMLILQETWTDASGSLVVYAPVDIPAMQDVMNGGEPSGVALLPSGFAILPDGSSGGGSLLTVAFQILVNSLPTAKLTVDSVETVNNLISCTVHKIKSSLHCHTTS